MMMALICLCAALVVVGIVAVLSWEAGHYRGLREAADYSPRYLTFEYHTVTLVELFQHVDERALRAAWRDALVAIVESGKGISDDSDIQAIEAAMREVGILEYQIIKPTKFVL